MQHVLVMLYVLAFAAGAAALSTIRMRARVERQEFLRVYLQFLIVLNLCVGLNLAMTYLEGAVEREAPLRENTLTLLLLSALGMGLVGGIVDRSIGVLWRARRRVPPPRTGRAIAGLVLLGILWTLATRWIPGVGVSPSPSRTVNLVLIATATAASAWALWGCRGRGELWADGARRLAALHLVAYLTLLVAFFLPSAVAWLLLVLAFLQLNLIPLLLLRRLPAMSSGEAAADPEDPRCLRIFAESYGVSVREREIVAQILTGKTNAEMAEALYISASTVKNHIHSVYQKCGARNRVELTRLVREAGNGAREPETLSGETP